MFRHGTRETRRLSACVLESVRGFTRKPREVVKLSSRMPEPIDAALGGSTAVILPSMLLTKALAKIHIDRKRYCATSKKENKGNFLP